jgi:hypothetical protein
MATPDDRDRKKVHAVHEVAHALVGHAAGFTIRSIEIDPDGSDSKTEIDRGFDCDQADRLIRDRATTEDQILELLPLLKRDLAGRLAGIAALRDEGRLSQRRS